MSAETRLPIRRSIRLSEIANEQLKTLPKKYGVTQFDFLTILLESAKENDIDLITRCQEINHAAEEEKKLTKELRSKLNDLSPEEMEIALKAIGR